ncbi:methyltransferase regulatory domain-containing protein [Planctomycetota bacterium]
MAAANAISIEESYDKVPYPAVAASQSQPDNLAAIATVWGMSPASPSGCRVLELGCATGGNLTPLSYRHPEARFLGLDISGGHVAEGQRIISELGVENVTLRHMDLMDVDESLGTFDYILVPGVYSWVPAPVQRKILDVCRQSLAPQGVAYVSYNTYPGWHMRGMIRDMMLYHSHDITEPQEKVGQARALLTFLAKVVPGGKTPYGELLRGEVDQLQWATDSYLYHDHLAEHNEPVYFHEFMKCAHESGLQYMGEARFSTNFPGSVPKDAIDKLRQSGDIVKYEQYMDFVRNRSFRQTLLVHEDVRLARGELDWRPMTSLRFSSSAGVGEQEVDPLAAEPVTFSTKAASMTTEAPIVKAAFVILARRWPQSVSFEDLLAQARDMVGGNGDSDKERHVFGASLASCYASGIAHGSLTPIPVAAGISERPESFPYARLQVHNRTVRPLTSLRHESIALHDLLRLLVLVADGTRDRDGILEALVDRGLQGDVRVKGPDGKMVESRQELQVKLDEVVDDLLTAVYREAFLIG